MIELFKSLLGAAPVHRPLLKSKAAGTGAKKAISADWRAVSLLPGAACAAVEHASAGKRYLLREAPRLPLAACPDPMRCSCRYRKYGDRRGDDRRMLGGAPTATWYAGAERRFRRSRRASIA